MPEDNQQLYTQRWRIVIHLSGRIQPAMLYLTGPEPTQDAYIVRVGPREGTLQFRPGSPLIVISGPDAALRVARQAGYPVGDTDERFARYRNII